MRAVCSVDFPGQKRPPEPGPLTGFTWSCHGPGKPGSGGRPGGAYPFFSVGEMPGGIWSPSGLGTFAQRPYRSLPRHQIECAAHPSSRDRTSGDTYRIATPHRRRLDRLGSELWSIRSECREISPAFSSRWAGSPSRSASGTLSVSTLFSSVSLSSVVSSPIRWEPGITRSAEFHDLRHQWPAKR